MVLPDYLCHWDEWRGVPVLVRVLAFETAELVHQLSVGQLLLNLSNILHSGAESS